MDEKEKCINHYNKLIGLLEEDAQMISMGIDGEIMGAYRQMVEREESSANTIINKLRLMQ